MNAIRDILTILMLYLSSRVLTVYLQPRFPLLLTAALFAALLLSLRFIRRARPDLPRRALPLMSIFSALFALSLVMGYHLQIKKAYDGLIGDNIITPYSLGDAAAFFLMFPGILLPALALCALGARLRGRTAAPCRPVPAMRRNLFLLILAGYIPYLLLYWPGLVMSDTMTSLHEALGYTALTSHHPVLYTLWIRLCLAAGRLTGGGNTAGCVIYCLVQMSFMAWTFAFMTDRIIRRLNLPAAAGYALGAVFAFTPCIAGYSVAMWKDPVFSCALILLSIRLYDYICAPSRSLLIRILLISALVTASRSNGFYVMLFVFLCAGAAAAAAGAVKKSSRPAITARPLLSLVIGLLLLLSGARIIHGPVYRSLGILEKKEEAVGIFLNQMARAAVCGTLSEKDAAYMDSLLPLELYPEAYTPCTADHLKWNSRFDRTALEDGFFRHWLSILRSNPKVYFDAWQLETAGFWAVNISPVKTFARNIQGGVPRNLNPDLQPELDNVGIRPANLLGSDSLRDLFPLNEWSVPVSWISWLVLYLFLSRLSVRERHSPAALLALAPSLGLTATLLLASPIWYWPRYGAALQFMLPFYAALFLPDAPGGVTPSRSASASSV